VGAERWDEQVGSVADEATRLLESLRRSAEAAAQSAAADPPAADVAAGESPAGDEAPHAGGPESNSSDAPAPAAHDPFCTWCPLCRGAAVVRSLSPETLTRLADLAALAATVLTDLAGSRAAGEHPASERASAAASDPVADGARGSRDDARRPARSTPRPRRASPATSNPIPVSDADDPQEDPRG
jgi:hypothetical protein